jgi:hypothetical protein
MDTEVMTNSNAPTGAETKPIQVTRSAPVRVQLKKPGFQNLNLFREIEVAINGCKDINELFRALADLVTRESDCVAMWVTQLDEEEGFSEFHPVTDPDANIVWDTVSATGRQVVDQASRTRQVISAAVTFQPQTHLVASPVLTHEFAENSVRMIVVGCFETHQHSIVRMQWLMGLTSQAIQIWLQRGRLQQSLARQTALNDSLRMIRSLDGSADMRQAARHVVNHLRRQCQAEQVSIVLNGQLVAVSDIEQVDTSSQLSKVIEQACRQAENEGSVVHRRSGTDSDSFQVTLDHYCQEINLEGCLNYPLVSNEGIFGAVLIGVSGRQLQDSSYLEYASQVTEMIGGHLDVVIRANQGVTQFARSRLKQFSTIRWRKYALGAALVAAIILCIPFPYRVGCECQLQPVLRRFVAAPHEGILERTLVDNGDIVRQGQLLAQMEGRHLRIELAGLDAELTGAKKRRDTALAKGEIAQSQIARSEMERYAAKIELLEEQLKNLDVRSPIDGIVVSGDLEKVEGAPLELGQTLYEVAPLDEMVSEILIPESEIQYVKPGMAVEIKLNAYPFKTWSGEISRIHPRAEVIEEDSVFVADVQMTNAGVELKPGMKGSAKIQSGWSPLAWNLFHQPWEAIRYWTIW